VIDKDKCPADLEVTAWTDDGTIMAVRHKQHPHIQGVQFHPESIITHNGKRIVANFVASCGVQQQQQRAGEQQQRAGEQAQAQPPRPQAVA
jgi:GMP synthase-like glutamine amidotransferase